MRDPNKPIPDREPNHRRWRFRLLIIFFVAVWFAIVLAGLRDERIRIAFTVIFACFCAIIAPITVVALTVTVFKGVHRSIVEKTFAPIRRWLGVTPLILASTTISLCFLVWLQQKEVVATTDGILRWSIPVSLVVGCGLVVYLLVGSRAEETANKE